MNANCVTYNVQCRDKHLYRPLGVTAEEHEEHVISIIASLMKNTRGSQRQRLLGKFTEGDHEKVFLDRVL